MKDESGIPKNDVSFKFNFEIKQENIQNFALYFEWFGTNGENTERIDGGLFETWAPKSADGILIMIKTYEFNIYLINLYLILSFSKIR